MSVGNGRSLTERDNRETASKRPAPETMEAERTRDRADLAEAVPAAPVPGDAFFLLAGWVLSVAMITLYPFDFGSVEKDARLGFFGRGLRLSDTIDVALNVLLFLPIGAMLSHVSQTRFRSRRAALALAGAVGLAMSGAVECLQMYLPARNSSFADILANTGGALAGGFAEQTWGAQGARVRKTASPGLLAAATLALSLLSLSGSALLQLQSGLGNWSLDYPLLIGNEETGDRPWRGRVFHFVLSDAATPPESLRSFATGHEIAVAGTRIAAADFSGSAPHTDVAGGHFLEWTRKGKAAGAGQVRHGSWLRTSRPASELARRIRATNAFTLRVRCATAGVHQSGPARIISNSADASHRNFTLGQQGGALIVRLRTRLTGPNGTNPEAVVGGVFTDTRPRDILITYDGASLWTTVGGSSRVQAMRFTPGTSLKAMYDPIRAEELPAQKLGYLAALFVVPGALFGVFAQTSARRVAVCAAWMLVFTILFEGALVQASGRRFEWRNVGVTVLVGAVVLTLVGGSVSTITSRRSS